MGAEHSFEGPGMVLDSSRSPSTQAFLSGTDSVSGGIRSGTPSKEGNQESEIAKVSGPSLLCPEEGLGQKEGDSGLVHIEQVHSMRQVPDVDNRSGAYPTTPWGLHHLY